MVHCCLGVYDKEGKPVYVGKVGTGFTQETIRVLIDKFEKIKTDVAPFKPEAGDIVTWLEPKLVCEVAYQVLTRDMRLRMARFKRLRDDKPPEQCTIDQVIEIKKTESPAKINQKKERKLSEYASKRHFEETPEPKGSRRKKERKTNLCYPRTPCKKTPLRLKTGKRRRLKKLGCSKRNS